MVVFPNSKINLGLQILRKRNDGFHDLDTVFYPVPLQDALEIIQLPNRLQKSVFSTSGKEIEGDKNENICLKAYDLLKKNFSELPGVRMHLHKTIPSGAGLGGGSADGAFTLLLLNKKFKLGLSEQMLLEYALQLGSDCPFFIKNKPCFARGRGEDMEEINLDLSTYTIVLVNPGIHVSTKLAFSMVQSSDRRNPVREIINQPVLSWKDVLKNDFEESVFSAYPEIGKIKEVMYESGAVYASMTGSGSTVYGLFEKNTELSFNFPSHYFVKSV
ncbi:MAG: 4-(cytidine 5'-diphospho)-2-C-methyl-D-erythritol kinase [Flavisolibacter sp.]